MENIHFLQRVLYQTVIPNEVQKHVEEALKKLLKNAGAQEVTVKVFSSHVHVFAKVHKQDQAATFDMMQEVLHKEFDSIQWNIHRHILPISSVSKKYIKETLEVEHGEEL